jgi:hypothetical protein
MKAKEYYKSTRMVDTMHWTLDMAMSFAEEYHKNEMKALRIHDVVGRSEQLLAFVEFIDKDLIDNVKPSEIVERFLSQ